MQNNSTPDFGPPGVAPPPNYHPISPAPGVAPPPPLIDVPMPTPQPILGPAPVVTVCPSCALRMSTRTENETSSSLCCCISRSESRVHHYCTNCNAFIGTYES
ncbi:hypothetical protein ILUMI_09089 [Ignelater luminosus]|uniref:LITAF domain-containing protein n=1 Tax=Ignelater luminosus TaxID=2038154 RepID=A0A8K0GEV1_IGNLU|nr:hypothetical protein ILUMI_09089 [Ignelater luminosus]